MTYIFRSSSSTWERQPDVPMFMDVNGRGWTGKLIHFSHLLLNLGTLRSSLLVPGPGQVQVRKTIHIYRYRQYVAKNAERTQCFNIIWLGVSAAARK